MFTNQCTECHRTQLIFPSMFDSVTDGPSGPAISYTCWCGAAQVWAPTTTEKAEHLQVA